MRKAESVQKGGHLQGRLRLLHVFPTFAVGGSQARFCTIANRLGETIHHLILPLDGCTDACMMLEPSASFEILEHPNAGQGNRVRHTLIRQILLDLQPDLLLTYNWGAMDWVIANSIFSVVPNIHTEDGFNEDEALRQKRRRIWARRIFLRKVTRVVVPSLTLKEIARGWWVPADRLSYIPNGVDLGAASRADAEPRPASKGVTIGTVASIRKVKNIGRLIRLFKRLPPGLEARLSIVGDGPDLDEVRKEAGSHPGIVFHGYQRDSYRFIKDMDIFALTSDSEQMPIAVVEAMAMGKPILSTDVGDVRNIVGKANQDFVANSEELLLDSLIRLVRDGRLREALGRDNMARCRQMYDVDKMLDQYYQLYLAAASAQAATPAFAAME